MSTPASPSRPEANRLRAPKWLRPYLPNTSTRLGLVSLDDPGKAHWPVRLTQIIGGRTWSLSLVTNLTPKPVRTDRQRGGDRG